MIDSARVKGDPHPDGQATMERPLPQRLRKRIASRA